MNEGMFISFEGIDGSGKSTQVKLLSNWMSKRAIKHIVTKEPGSPFIDECLKMRSLLLDTENDIVPLSELFLFLADRAQHVEKLIRPELKKGNYVICDRFIDSTRAYQCARGLSRDKVDNLINFATAGLIPNITLVLDLPVEVGLKRAKAKNMGDRMESAGDQFYKDVRYGFLKLAESIEEQHRFQVINAAPPRTIEEIHSEIVDCVSKKIWVDSEGK